jgi:Domain of unknown function (DUF5615)
VRWLVDECIDAALVAHLRRSNHDVVYVAEIAPAAGDVRAYLVIIARDAKRVLELLRKSGEERRREARAASGILKSGG